MLSRFDSAGALAARAAHAAEWGDALALRIYTSRLLGSDPSLVLHGGGNTSVKTLAHEVDGTRVEVLYVKGSGHDLATIGPRGFPACRLEPLRRLCALERLSDDDMVRALRAQMLDPSSPTPSVEALLHAWIRPAYVDHTHADAVLAVLDRPGSAEHAREVWGPEIAFVPYVMPGFVLARAVVALSDTLERASLLVLDKHGLFTWGTTAEESYERMITAVTAAERWVEARGAAWALSERAAATPAVAARHADDTAERQARRREIAPRVRGAVARARTGRRFVAAWRTDPEVVALSEHPAGRALAEAGPATPDHVIRVRPWPAWLELEGAADQRSAADRAVAAFGERYDAYVADARAARGCDPKPLDRLPRIVVVPGLGALALGATLADAHVAGDVFAHDARVMLDTSARGEYRPVGARDLFDVEYWSLEQAKLGKATAPPLAGRVALVTGGAGGIGLATAAHLLELGAHVLVTDRDSARLDEAHEALARAYGQRVAKRAGDVTSEDSVREIVGAAVEAFGGLDLLVSNAGTAPSGLLHHEAGAAALEASLEVNLLSHQRVARAAVEAMVAQGMGGCLLFNASKSAFAPGPEFGPYAVAKAGVVALMRQYAIDAAPHGIRANAVNADRIRTPLFGGGVLEARARARGLTPDEYFRQNLLRRETLASDVAEAFTWLARAEATTGCVVTVDGGNPAAFPR